MLMHFHQAKSCQVNMTSSIYTSTFYKLLFAQCVPWRFQFTAPRICSRHLPCKMGICDWYLWFVIWDFSRPTQGAFVICDLLLKFVMSDKHEQILHDDPRTYYLYIVQNSLRILKNSEKEAQCHLLSKLSSGVQKIKINKPPPKQNKFDWKPFWISSQFSSSCNSAYKRRMLPRIPGESTLGSKIIIYLWYLYFQLLLFQLKRLLNLRLQRLFFSSIQTTCLSWHTSTRCQGLWWSTRTKPRSSSRIRGRGRRTLTWWCSWWWRDGSQSRLWCDDEEDDGLQHHCLVRDSLSYCGMSRRWRPPVFPSLLSQSWFGKWKARELHKTQLKDCAEETKGEWDVSEN